MAKTYTFGTLGVPMPKLEPLPFPEPDRMMQQLMTHLAMAKARIEAEFMLPEHILRGEMIPTIDGECTEIMPLAIKGPA